MGPFERVITGPARAKFPIAVGYSVGAFGVWGQKAGNELVLALQQILQVVPAKAGIQ